MQIDPGPPKRIRDYTKATSEFASATVTAVSSLAAGQPGGVIAAISPIIEASRALSGNKKATVGTISWTVVRSAFGFALAKLFSARYFDAPPAGEELRTLISDLTDRLEFLIRDHPQEISAETIYAPLKIFALRKITNDLPHHLRPYSLHTAIGECRRDFERFLFEGVIAFRNAHPDDFIVIESAISGALQIASERRGAIARHHSFLLHSFTQAPIFGQEDSGITLSDLYVRQRAIWVDKVEREKSDGEDCGSVEEVELGALGSDFFGERASARWQYPLHIAHLHETLNHWLHASDDDAIRVVAGGPGSGKSTFARAFAIEVIDRAEHDVLFIPLQEIEPSGSFGTRIENLLKTRTDMGLERTPNALDWLGQREQNGEPPTRPLLLICDGLDEIAPPGSAEAATVTTDFIQALSTWISARNSGGLFVRALILGRTISAQDAFSKLNINHHALIRVGGFLPISRSDEWIKSKGDDCVFDPNNLADLDQRAEYWSRWSTANNLESEALPVALQGDTEPAKALEELTTEPLLLYLLIWTGYLGKHWEKAADNRNVVYEEIFKQIYMRKWGGVTSKQTNREKGGHVGTDAIDLRDFFILQEALGLASWASGGRTVSVDAYKATCLKFIDPDKYEDLAASASSSLRSVALQGYSRSVGGENAGFEFVHKSIGEYLIARSLVTVIGAALQEVRDRISDSRCAKAAAVLAKIFGQGSLTQEIFRFFRDEMRMRYPDPKKATSILQQQMTPVMNWVLKHGFPVQAEHASHDGISLSRTEISNSRISDVTWTALQSFGEICYTHLLSRRASEDPVYGRISLDWPTPQSFISLFSRICSRALIAENKRMSSFNHLNLCGQALTDYSFGGVIYSDLNIEGSISPSIWLPASFVGCDLHGAKFYGSVLREADLRYSRLTSAMLDRVSLRNAQIDFCDMSDSSIEGGDFEECSARKANFSGSSLNGAIFSHSNLNGAIFERARFRSRTRVEVRPTVFSNCDMSDVKAAGVNFGNSVIALSRHHGADYRGSNFTHAQLFSNKWEGADADDAEFPGKGVLEDSDTLPNVGSKPATEGERPSTRTVIVLSEDSVSVASVRGRFRQRPRVRSRRK